MKTIKTTLKKESLQLKQVMSECEKRLKNAPKGKLRIARKKNRFDYYYVDEKGKKGGRYLKKKEVNLARKIAQRDYDIILLQFAGKRLSAIEKFLEDYEKSDLRHALNKVNPYRNELISSHYVSDEEFIKQWQNLEYEKKGFEDSTQEIITEKGERVRSKSEKIIADKLYMLEIPYRYECPLVLEGNVKVYPDFTIVKMPERKEVYLEHFGMMDDVNYVNMVIHKLSTYEKNGIYLGVNLFLTFETSKRPLNVRALDEMIKDLWGGS